MNATAFYLPHADGAYDATVATAGPWGPELQHAGPPAALAARALERLPAEPGLRIARVTVDILRPVPVAPLTVTTRVLRPGRRTELVEATVSAGSHDVLRVAAWRVASPPDGAPAAGPALEPPAFPGPQPPLPEGLAHLDGYMSAVEWRFASGGFDQAGPAAAWARPLLPLVAGEDASPLQRVLLLADSGNGVGTAVDRRRWLSINTDLAVSLHRDPEGEWLCLQSDTTITPGAAATTDTLLFDRTGAVGRATQTLLVDALGAA
jgi:Thioesterase-like superfamily